MSIWQNAVKKYISQAIVCSERIFFKPLDFSLTNTRNIHMHANKKRHEETFVMRPLSKVCLFCNVTLEMPII